MPLATLQANSSQMIGTLWLGETRRLASWPKTQTTWKYTDQHTVSSLDSFLLPVFPTFPDCTQVLLVKKLRPLQRKSKNNSFHVKTGANSLEAIELLRWRPSLVGRRPRLRAWRPRDLPVTRDLLGWCDKRRRQDQSCGHIDICCLVRLLSHLHGCPSVTGVAGPRKKTRVITSRH